MEREDDIVGLHISPRTTPLPHTHTFSSQTQLTGGISFARALQKIEMGGQKRNSTAMSVLLCEYLGSAALWSSCHCCHASLSHEIGNIEKYKS